MQENCNNNLSTNRKYYQNTYFNKNFPNLCINMPICYPVTNEQYFQKLINSDRKVILSIMNFLEFNEVINLRSISKIYKNKITKKVMKNYIEITGLTELSRNTFWFNNLPIDQIVSETKKQMEIVDDINSNKLFNIILQKAHTEISNDQTHFKSIADEIRRDLNRTFHSGVLVTAAGQDKLKSILLSIAYIRPEVNYCQGMNFVAGALLEFFGDVFAFWIFLIFLDKYELNDLYSKNMPDYQIRIFQLDYFMKKYIPKIYNHFIKNDINSDIFMSKFFITIFSSFFPFKILCKLWDIFLIDKWKCIFKFIIIILKELEDKILKMDLYEISKFFREISGKNNIFFNNIFTKYDSIKITNSEIQTLKEDFFLLQIKSKLEDPDSEWDTDQLEAYNIYKAYLDDCNFSIEIEKKNLSVKNQEIKSKYESAKAEYNFQHKRCKFIKINLEEMIEKKSAFHNTLLILNNEMLSLSEVIAREKEKEKALNKKQSKLNIPNGKKISLPKDKNNNVNFTSNNFEKINCKIKKENYANVTKFENISHFNLDLENSNKIQNKKKSFLNFGFFKKDRNVESKKELSEIKNNDFRSKSSTGTKDNNSLRFMDTENELIKINKKLNQTLQNIELQNKLLFENYSLLDTKKQNLEKLKIEQFNYKNILNEFEKKSESQRRHILKELVDKLRLSEKFVKTQKF